MAVLTSPGQVCHEGFRELSRSIFQEVQVSSWVHVSDSDCMMSLCSSVPGSVHWLRTWPMDHQASELSKGSPETAPHCLFCNFFCFSLLWDDPISS